MAVLDHGLEAIRKSAVEVTPGDKSEYQLRMLGLGSFSLTGLKTAGRITEVIVDDTGWVPLPATLDILANTNSVEVQNNSGNGNTLLLNFVSGALIGNATIGRRVVDGGFKNYAIQPGIVIYGRMQVGTGLVTVEQLS